MREAPSSGAAGCVALLKSIPRDDGEATAQLSLVPFAHGDNACAPVAKRPC
jgi:hypothetical protein